LQAVCGGLRQAKNRCGGWGSDGCSFCLSLLCARLLPPHLSTHAAPCPFRRALLGLGDVRDVEVLAVHGTDYPVGLRLHSALPQLPQQAPPPQGEHAESRCTSALRPERRAACFPLGGESKEILPGLVLSVLPVARVRPAEVRVRVCRGRRAVGQPGHPAVPRAVHGGGRPGGALRRRRRHDQGSPRA